MTHFNFWLPCASFGTGEERHINVGGQIDSECYVTVIDYLGIGCVHGCVTSLNFGK